MPPVTPPVGEYVARLLSLLGESGALSNAEILEALGLMDRRRMRETYIDPALKDGLIERTIPHFSFSFSFSSFSYCQ